MRTIELKEIKTVNYDRPAIQKGYAGQTLRLDLSDASTTLKPVDDKMKEVFICGQGHDKMEGPGKHRLYRFRPHGRYPRLSGFGQKHCHGDITDHRFGYGFQCRRVFRSLPEVCRF